MVIKIWWNRAIAAAILGMIPILAQPQSSWYVSQQEGSDSNDGSSPETPYKTVDHAVESLGPGDTLFFMGLFTNPNYIEGYSFGGDINDPHIWLDEHTVKINDLHGTPGNYITLKPFDNEAVLRGDGSNLVRITNASYLRIEGFDMQGEVENIPLSTALALQFLYRDPVTNEVLYRVPPGTPPEEVANMTFPVLGSVQRPSYTDTRGLYMSDVKHVVIRGNVIHHTPGNGLRVADCEYVDILDNEVHNCSRKSYSGTHGLVVTKAVSTDNLDNYKVNILRNKVHHNYNEIYSWSPQKSFITPRIDEGKGISLQRNAESNWTHGRFLVANNLCYWNGFSGVHSNTGKRMDFINNTCYFNSYTNTVTYAGGEQLGKNIGISAQSSEDIRIINNVVYIDNGWGGYPISISGTDGFVISDNMVHGDNGSLAQDPDATAIQVNTHLADPLFASPDDLDFSLQAGSPAIGMADPAFAPDDDLFGNPRDEDPDLGAIEYLLSSATGIEAEGPSIRVCPNPFRDEVWIHSTERVEQLEVITLDGRVLPFRTHGLYRISIDLSRLEKGFYLLRVNDRVMKIVKDR